MKALPLGMALGILLLLLSLPLTGFLISPAAETALVERVIDGDTLELSGGERVRLLGIDTPERGQHLFQESTALLSGLVEGKQVTLEKDATERDKYGRLLRYVFYQGSFINLELVRAGYATALLYEPDTKHADLLLQEEARARSQGGGIWAFPPDNFCVGIFSLRSNARGDDNENLNDEYVVFRNKCPHPLRLGGWVLADNSGNAYTFPPIELENKSYLTLHTGAGEDNGTDLFWGKGRAVWNNQMDSLLLREAGGSLLLNYTYAGR